MSSRIRVVVADDEPLAREAVLLRLQSEPDFEVVAECGNGAEVVAVLERERPDLLFLDVRMPVHDGFEALGKVDPGSRPLVVFVSAFSDRAVEAFGFEAVDYLTKPFDDLRFQEALRRVRARWAHGNDAASAGVPVRAPLVRLLVKRNHRVMVLPVLDIDYFQAADDYVHAWVGDRRFLLDWTLQALAERLDRRVFVRIHRSAIVHLDRIRDLETRDGRDWEVRLVSGASLRLSRTYRAEFERLLGDRL